jgi:hypothetical protein
VRSGLRKGFSSPTPHLSLLLLLSLPLLTSRAFSGRRPRELLSWVAKPERVISLSSLLLSSFSPFSGSSPPSPQKTRKTQKKKKKGCCSAVRCSLSKSLGRTHSAHSSRASSYHMAKAKAKAAPAKVKAKAAPVKAKAKAAPYGTDKWGRPLLKGGKLRPHPKNWGLRKPLGIDKKTGKMKYSAPAGPPVRPPLPPPRS